MDGGLLSCKARGGLLTVEELLHPWNMPNLTQLTFQAMMPPIPDSGVKFRHGLLGGKPESGKTSYYNAIALEAIRRYGRENLNIIATKSLKLGITRLDRRPVQLVMTDDAVRNSNSRKAQKNADDVADFYEIRHIYEEVAQTFEGVIITFFAAQRYMSLDNVFRDGDVLIFKTTPTNPADQKLVRDFIGLKAYDQLKAITKRIYIDNDDRAKSEAVVAIPSADKTGTIRLNYVRPFLKFIDERDTLQASAGSQFTFSKEQALEQLRHSNKWREVAEVYFRSEIQGENRQHLAEAKKVTTQRISQIVSEVRGELSRVGGEAYEVWKCEQLRRQGYHVQHLGRSGQPDIIVKNKDGQTWVYSCKCLDFTRKITIPSSEITPEIHEALKLGCDVKLSIFNLADRTEQVIHLDAKEPRQKIPVSPVRAY